MSTYAIAPLVVVCLMMKCALYRAQISNYCATFTSNYDSINTKRALVGSFHMSIDSNEQLGY